MRCVECSDYKPGRPMGYCEALGDKMIGFALAETGCSKECPRDNKEGKDEKNARK